MAKGRIRVGIVGANVGYGWGSSAHTPALNALPEFEIIAVCTSRQETADETAKYFEIPLASQILPMVNHRDVDLVCGTSPQYRATLQAHGRRYPRQEACKSRF
jgi:predicted dehydrogenase